MRSLVVYSSRTGNTKMIAEAVLEAMPEGCAIAPVAGAPDPGDFDLLALGFWVDKGQPDKDMIDYMGKVRGKKIGLFGTLGAWPDSDHAREAMRKATAMLEGNTVLGTFLCQGKIDPKVLAIMEKMRDMQKAHPVTDERKARIAEAEKHPDAADCENARARFREIVAKA